MKKIVVIGGTFSPPGEHHRKLVEKMNQTFDQIILVPCGPRPDKPVVNDVEPNFRAAMADMAFNGIPKVEVDLFDLEEDRFTRTHLLQERFSERGEIWHGVASELVLNGKINKSVIHTEWENGSKLWEDFNFLVLRKPNENIDPNDLPPKSQVFDMPMDGSSEKNRELLYRRESLVGLVSDTVLQYIERHGLYRGTRTAKSSIFSASDIRPLVLVDEGNALAKKITQEKKLTSHANPNVILVIGGDGFMLKSIRNHWRRRLPFFGLNAGRLGFLLNESINSLQANETLTLHQLPLLWVQSTKLDAKKRNDFAFNDAWMERATGQTAHFKISLNHKEKMTLVSDAALLSTAAGSASYARAMGAPPLPINTQALLLVGSNVLNPYGWKCAVLPSETQVEIEGLDPQKRPVSGYIDGVAQGPLLKMDIRVSRTAAVELLFDPKFDPAEKLGKIQFP